MVVKGLVGHAESIVIESTDYLRYYWYELGYVLLPHGIDRKSLVGIHSLRMLVSNGR